MFRSRINIAIIGFLFLSMLSATGCGGKSWRAGDPPPPPAPRSGPGPASPQPQPERPSSFAAGLWIYSAHIAEFRKTKNASSICRSLGARSNALSSIVSVDGEGRVFIFKESGWDESKRDQVASIDLTGRLTLNNARTWRADPNVQAKVSVKGDVMTWTFNTKEVRVFLRTTKEEARRFVRGAEECRKD